MTAEIGMLNRYGVALAADSAVTTTTPNGYRKVYNSANKVFMLSEVAPLGIMVYGNASFMEIPWETIIKLYRKKLDKRLFPNLREYANDFLLFVINDITIDDVAKSNYVFGKLYEFLNIELSSCFNENKACVLDDVLLTLNGILENIGILDPFGDGDDLFNGDLHQEIINAINNKFLQNNITLEGPKIEEIMDLFQKYIKINYFTNETGVVIAGFGESEYFPSLVSYKLEGKVGDILKYTQVEDISIGPSRIAEIVPFAQTSMVHTFIKGINPELMDHLRTQFDTTVHDLINEIGNTVITGLEEDAKKVLFDALHEAGSNALYKQFSNLADYQSRNHIMPIVDTVKMLNKDELAEMAESLVSITSIEKKMSMEIETVGGPIDVAIISKGDGFIWYKRKHYFDPKLNSHYFRNKGM